MRPRQRRPPNIWYWNGTLRWLIQAQSEKSMNMDEAEAFVNRFAHIIKLSDIRKFDEYECPDLTDDLFVRLATEIAVTKRSVVDRDFLHRFTSVCIQYLYRDLRSLQAIEVMIEHGIDEPDIFGIDGCNSLGALSLVAAKLCPDDVNRLTNLCKSALRIPILAHNANRFLMELGNHPKA